MEEFKTIQQAADEMTAHYIRAARAINFHCDEMVRVWKNLARKSGGVVAEIKAFVKPWQEQAAMEYRRHHGRLPGSERTKRLRKKRWSKIYRWWFYRSP
jgi:transposase-like protein